MAWMAATALYPVLRVEGRIAQRQVLRRRVRTTLTIGLLYIAVSTAISLGTTILNCVEDIRTWQAKTFKGDFIVRAMMPDLATGETRSHAGIGGRASCGPSTGWPTSMSSAR